MRLPGPILPAPAERLNELSLALPSAEKEDDAKARAAIKLQIEADKKARAERTALEKSIRDGGVIDVSTGRAANVAKPAAAAAAGAAGAGKDYPETRLQVRWPPPLLGLGGETLTCVCRLVAGPAPDRRCAADQDAALDLDPDRRRRVARVRVARLHCRQRRHLNPLPEPDVRPVRVWQDAQGAGPDAERRASAVATLKSTARD